MERDEIKEGSAVLELYASKKTLSYTHFFVDFILPLKINKENLFIGELYRIEDAFMNCLSCKVRLVLDPFILQMLKSVYVVRD